ncbi:MAG: hypothetical protein Tsb009_28980 [Planctomycetaceae bacterium]
MSIAESSQQTNPTWYDRVSDWFNAILVKEARQSFKSRQFVSVFMLLLAVSWIVSVFGLLNSGPALEFGSVGRDFFYWFYVVLAFAAIVIVPFNAFRSLLNERDLNTYDLLSITTLSPRQIVWGKLFSSLVQLFVFYSAVTPFIAFSSLMQGFSAPNAALILIATMLLSVYLSMTALMVSTLSQNRALQALVSVGALSGLVFVFFTVIGGAFPFIAMDLISLSNPEFWWGVATAFLIGTSYFVLFHEIAVVRLTFESDNRSTRLRYIVMGQFWLLWTVFLIYILATNEPLDWRMLFVLVVLSGIHWTFHGLFAVTEDDALSRRVRREIPQTRFWRWLKTPFLPGGSRGYLLVLIHLAALWMIAVAAQGVIVSQAGGDSAEYLTDLYYMQSQSWSELVRGATGICCYLVIFLGIANLLGRWARQISSDIKPAHIRVLMFLLFAAGMIFPMLVRAIDVVKTNQYTLYDITAPHRTIGMLIARHSSQQVLFNRGDIGGWIGQLVTTRGYGDLVIVLLAGLALFTVAVNIPAMWISARDLKRYARKFRERQQGPVELVETESSQTSSSADAAIPAIPETNE